MCTRPKRYYDLPSESWHLLQQAVSIASKGHRHRHLLLQFAVHIVRPAPDAGGVRVSPSFAPCLPKG